mmetsp:Transcript_11200/g.24084  ORF Transcript_11200/g.24084 Transcript_11200/m.24084 type:complete len:325 (+) Transcript_11200:151-1125(+)
MSDVLQQNHADALVEYVRWLRRKREGCVAEVAAEFKETREMRLLEDMYSKEEVESILDGLLALVRTTIKKDLQTSMNSTVLLVKQIFEQVEKSGLSVNTDIMSTEDGKLLKEVEQWENSLTGGGPVPQLKARASVSKPVAKVSLGAVGQTQDPKLLSALEDERERNKELTDKFQKLQVQCTTILKTKSELQAQVDALTAENAALSSTANSSGDTATVLNAQVKKLEAELQSLRDAPLPPPVTTVSESDVASLMSELQGTQARVADLTSQLEEAQTEIQARIEKSKQFANMRQILAKKNAVVKDLRDQLSANGIAIKGDVEATED